MAFRTDLEALILGALADGPLHGYGIVKRIRESAGEVLKLGESQLYPILYRLEKDGTIVSEWEPQEGKPSRKTYALTELGKKELERQKKEWAKFVTGISAVMGMPNFSKEGNRG